jgi:dTDP-4-amino-4,6-dideoxygalactose transaminase
MAAAEAGHPASGSLLDLWRNGWAHFSAFTSARSALAALLNHRGAANVWLPAYICRALFEGAAASSAAVRFYPCSRSLEPHLEALARDLRPGDAVVGVDYFGRPASDAFLDLRRRRRDLIWIEDRAQALDPGRPPWGDVLIYSPRKLVGVADGGLMFSHQALPGTQGVGPADVWAPEEARALDPKGEDPQAWRPLFQAREAAVHVERTGVSPRTLALLGGLSADGVARVRRGNWSVLADRLGDLAMWPDSNPTFVPLAFPIVVEDPAATVAALAERRIWAPRHWADLPSDPGAFPDAHWLSAHCVSLPLDQRYGPAEMERVAEAARAFARPAAQAR